MCCRTCDIIKTSLVYFLISGRRVALCLSRHRHSTFHFWVLTMWQGQKIHYSKIYYANETKREREFVAHYQHHRILSYITGKYNFYLKPLFFLHLHFLLHELSLRLSFCLFAIWLFLSCVDQSTGDTSIFIRTSLYLSYYCQLSYLEMWLPQYVLSECLWLSALDRLLYYVVYVCVKKTDFCNLPIATGQHISVSPMS